jgi:hypothetical protein
MFIMNSLFGLCTVLLLNLAMAVSPYAGSWQVAEAFDESFEAVTLPEGTFFFNIEEKEDDPKVLILNLKVGNSMGTQITLLDDSNKVEIGGLMSTRMMPTEPLFKLETYLSNTLPKITTLELIHNNKYRGDQLVFGGQGKIVCFREDA